MKRLGLDVAFAKILLAAVPFNCGPPTFTEPVPPQRCTTARDISVPLSQILMDGGMGMDGGEAITDAGEGPDAGSLASYVLSPSECSTVCGDTMTCYVTTIDSGEAFVTCQSPCGYPVGCGRRPAALPSLRESSQNALARYFEQAAYLEAASVQAFRRLASELLAHGAPAWLVSSARRAADDELRHTKAMAHLARCYGGSPMLPPRGPHHIRPLVEMAMENTVEGCVRETYGALVAWLQTALACDPVVQRAMHPIAIEETGHAHLAWSVASWAAGRLTREERCSLDAARKATVSHLAEDIGADPPAALVRLIGLPPRSIATRLIAEAERSGATGRDNEEISNQTRSQMKTSAASGVTLL